MERSVAAYNNVSICREVAHVVQVWPFRGSDLHV